MFRAEYQISNKILNALNRLEATREVINLAELRSEKDIRFREEARVRSVYHGVSLGGNAINLVEVEKIIRDDPPRDEAFGEVAKRLEIRTDKSEVGEVLNYRNALRYVDHLIRLGSKRQLEYGEKELWQIHSLLLEKLQPSHKLGIYREGAVVEKLGISGGGSAPFAVEVAYQIGDFFRWLKGTRIDDIHPVLIAAMAAYELMRIKPFEMGNEKCSILFASLLLGECEYDLKRYISLEGMIEQRKNEGENIFDRLMLIDDKTSWLEWFCQGLAEEGEKVKERVWRIHGDDRFVSNGKQVALSERQVELIQLLEAKDEITMNQAREALTLVSDDTILRDLKDLLKKGIVKKKGKTKGARYILKK